MKQVINGKVYNTETAEKISAWDNGLGVSDFGHCWETLYRTKKGAYFIYGGGGALSPWSERCGNMTSGGKGIRVLSKEEALAWCETHEVDADVIAQHFEVEEG